jgi:predicted Rdx family selenoprotein
VSLQSLLQTKMGFKPPIKIAAPGEMKVMVNGREVFSYKAEGKMPGLEELAQRVTAAAAAS